MANWAGQCWSEGVIANDLEVVSIASCTVRVTFLCFKLTHVRTEMFDVSLHKQRLEKTTPVDGSHLRSLATRYLIFLCVGNPP